MSIEHLNKALKVEGLKPTAKFILIVLANYADEKGTCYPSYRHIANIVGLKDTKGVQRTIKSLADMGLLKINNRKNDSGGNTSNLYELTMGSETPTPLSAPPLRVTEPSNTKEDTKKYISSFQEFWKIYPRKIGKKQASKIFGKYDEKHYAKIIHGVRLFAQENKTTEERFIPHPSTWLNQERWMDWFEETDGQYVLKINKLNNLAG